MEHLPQNDWPISQRPSAVAQSLKGFEFRLATKTDDFQRVLKCRWKGFKHFGYESPQDLYDEFDEHAWHLIAIDQASGVIVGCLRLLRKPRDHFELEQWVNISEWIEQGYRPAELTRLSIPFNKQSIKIKFGLWKLALLLCLKEGQTHFIITTKHDTKRAYDFLCFQPYRGQDVVFNHPKIGNMPHLVMTLNLVGLSNEWLLKRPALYQFSFESEHPEIHLTHDTY
jgi:hypothetical protein